MMRYCRGFLPRLIVASLISASGALCPTGWIQADETCYYFGGEKLNWLQARLECASMNADLVSILNREENRLLQNIIDETSKSSDRELNHDRRRLAQPTTGGVEALSCFEKHPQSILVGFAEVVLNQPTAEACLRECQNAQSTYKIACNSVMYYSDSKDCILNTQTRLTKPDLFTTDASVDYYDNNCANQTTTVCYNVTDGMALVGFAEQVVTGVSLDGCKAECTGARDKYGVDCRSATYYAKEQSCILTKESRQSQPSLFGTDPAAVYLERSANCGSTNITGPCNNTNMDLMLVVDSSGSIGPQSFENVRQFLKSVSQSVKVDPNGSNIGLVQFNESPKTEFHLKSYQTNAEVSAAIDAMQWMSGYTLIGKALKYVQDYELIQSQGDRSPVPNVVLVITDGMSQDNPALAAQRLRSAGALTYAVGVTEAVSDDQLMNIAGSPDRVYKVTNFNQLDNKLRDQILKDVCNPPKPQPVTPSVCYPSPYVSCLPAGYPGGYPSMPVAPQPVYPQPPGQPQPPGPPAYQQQPTVNPPPPNPTGAPCGLSSCGAQYLPSHGDSPQKNANRAAASNPQFKRKDVFRAEATLNDLLRHRAIDFEKDRAKRNIEPSDQGDRNGFWIGLSDQLSEGQFSWSDGQGTNYSNWKFGEPDGHRGENCVVALIEPLQRWKDVACSNKNYFICKQTTSRYEPVGPG